MSYSVGKTRRTALGEHWPVPRLTHTLTLTLAILFAALAACTAPAKSSDAASTVFDTDATGPSTDDADAGASPTDSGPPQDVGPLPDAPSTSPDSGTASECNPQVPCPAPEMACRVAKCVDGSCQVALAAAGSACSDGYLCTTADACTSSGLCVGAQKPCDDGNPCTADKCAGKDGSCYGLAIPGTDCDDNNPCTVNTSCSNAGTCSGGKATSCDDGNVCTADSCQVGPGCVHLPTAASCADACSPQAVCSAGTCNLGPSLNCDDGNSCTTDGCDSGTGCYHSDSAAPCGKAGCTTGVCTAGSCKTGDKLWTLDPLTTWGNHYEWYAQRLPHGHFAVWWREDGEPGEAAGRILNRLGSAVQTWSFGCHFIIPQAGKAPLCIVGWGGTVKPNGQSASIQLLKAETPQGWSSAGSWPLAIPTSDYGPAKGVVLLPLASRETSPGVVLTLWAATDSSPVEEGVCLFGSPCDYYSALWFRSSDGKTNTVLPLGPGTWHSALGAAPTSDGGFVVGLRTGNQPARILRLSATGAVIWAATLPVGDYLPGTLVHCADGQTVVMTGTGSSVWLSADGNVVANAQLYAPGVYQGFNVFQLTAPDKGGIAVAHTDQSGALTLQRLDSARNVQWSRTYTSPTALQGRVLRATEDDGLLLAGIHPLNYTVWVWRVDAFGHRTCGEAGSCAGLELADCSDGSTCTADSCELPGGCTTTAAANGACSTGKPCWGNETCTAGVCGGGAPLQCSDNNLCTSDACSAATGCTNTVLPDGTPCAGTYVCIKGKCK